MVFLGRVQDEDLRARRPKNCKDLLAFLRCDLAQAGSVHRQMHLSDCLLPFLRPVVALGRDSGIAEHRLHVVVPEDFMQAEGQCSRVEKVDHRYRESLGEAIGKKNRWQ